MKGIYLPDTVERFILPCLNPISQLVLYKLLRYSGANYHGNIWPSVATLARLCHVKQKKTIRAALQDLKSWSLITWDDRFSQNRQTSNHYKLNFELFEQCDKMRGVKFKKKGEAVETMFREIKGQLESISDTQQTQIFAFEKWCRQNKFTVDVTQAEIDISYMNPFSQSQIKQAAMKRGLVLNFKTG